MGRTVINPPELKDTKQFGYSHAIVEDGTLYVSGQVAMDADSNIVGDDIATQTRKALENVGHLLDAVDRDHSDIAKVRSYIVDVHDRGEEFHEVWMDFFEPPYPCHTMIGVDALAFPEYLVELEIEAPVAE
jgi:enamine deaminase RidA (YjgF/YER057c/UK114 family)